MKILFINFTNKFYGGKAYERKALDILKTNFQIDFISAKKNFWKLFKISRKTDYDIAIRDLDSALFLNKKPTKNIVIVHHLDNSYSSPAAKFFYFIFQKRIFSNLKKCDAIITVSKYWKDFFEKLGFRNVYLIYNAFNLNDFNFTYKEIEEFKKKYNLTGKPIIYSGNCQKAKGVVESYEILKDLGVHLVTSGEPMVKTPARNLEIPHREYLKLLKASSVVLTMSKFKEGWCRTAHEAMLLKTPVIGSGRGGMKELLEGGKQIICEDFNFLRERVEYLLNHPEIRERMGEDGYNFAKDFNLERFKKDWQELINKVIY